MSMPDDFHDEATPRQGMSSTAKVLLVLGSIAGVLLLACCGGMAFVGWKFQGVAKTIAQNFPTNNPEEIRARTAKIVHIDIPEEFPPLIALDLFVMKEIIYGKQGGGAMVMIIEINQQMQGAQGAAGAKQQRQEILRQMRQQAGQQPDQMNTDLAEESSETREFDINGEKVTFDFIKGTAAHGGTPTRQVVGLFNGRQGTVMVMLMVPESAYDEESVVKMIESIRLPGAEAADDADDASEMPQGEPTGEHDDSAAEILNPASDNESSPAVPSEATP